MYENDDSAIQYLIDTNQLAASTTDYDVYHKLVDKAGDTYIGNAADSMSWIAGR